MDDLIFSATISRAHEILRQARSKAALPDVVVAAIVLADILVPVIDAAVEKILSRR